MIMASLHFTLLPSGVFYGHTTSVIGNGVALNIPVPDERDPVYRRARRSEAKDSSFRPCTDGYALPHSV